MLFLKLNLLEAAPQSILIDSVRVDVFHLTQMKTRSWEMDVQSVWLLKDWKCFHKFKWTKLNWETAWHIELYLFLFTPN